MVIRDFQIPEDPTENQLKFINKKEIFSKKLELPIEPGIYQFFDSEENLLYVGKAKNLKNRLSSYLNKGTNKKASNLRNRINFVELIITKSESDALILEQSLIRKKKPPFNVQFRDDKSYPIIHIATDKEFPNIYISRRKQKEGTSFGPYANVGAMRKNIEIAQKIFKLRSCKDMVFKNRTRPCIEYQIGRCSAPCTGMISKNDYQEDVRQATDFFNGKNETILKDLYKKMDGYSSKKDYERALIYRDKINAIRDTQKNQTIFTLYENVDVIGITSNSYDTCISLVQVREGWVTATKNFFPDTKNEYKKESLLVDFIESNYLNGDEKNINLLAFKPIANEVIHNLQKLDVNLNQLKLDKKNKFLLEIAESQSQDRLKRKDHFIWVQQAFENLCQKLALQKIEKIEAFDISHISGKNVTASCVSFTNKGPDKKEYRSMNITNDKNDDYLALSEAINRRINSLEKRSLPLPEIILIDGGKGQLNSVREVLKSKNLDKIKLISVSKGPDRNEKYDRLHIDNIKTSVDLNSEKEIEKLIQFMRNESHRFALYKHRARRSKSFINSDLDNIKFIGEAQKKNLIRHFGGVKRLKDADIADLLKVDGIGLKKASIIHEHFH
ncbi:MAG: excinuclease ABC subunit UvrC [Gammaproteobacteria bacterium]